MNSAGLGVAETEGRLSHYVTGLFAMALGSTVVLGAVVLMNELSAPPERKEVERVTEIEIEKQPKPKPKQQVRQPKPKPRKPPKAPPRPAVSQMPSNVAGIAFDLPGLRFEDLGGADAELLQTKEDVVHTGDTVDTKPQPVEQPEMEYPRRLRDRGIEGFVELSVLLDESGNIQRVKVLESKPPGEFDQAALEGIRKWRFSPALYKGEPVSVWVNQTIRFNLAKR